MDKLRNLSVLTLLTIVIIVSVTAMIAISEMKTEEPVEKEDSVTASSSSTGVKGVNDAESTNVQMFIRENDYYRGNREAKLAFIEYSDLECPYCKRYHSTMKQVIEEYGDQVLWVFRHFPLDNHPNARKAAEAAECVGVRYGNEAFWEFTDLYFSRTSSNGYGFPRSDLAALAAEVGANQSDIQSCLDSDEMSQKVMQDFESGVDSGVTGTPGTIMINSGGSAQVISGALPYEQMKDIINSVLSP